MKTGLSTSVIAHVVVLGFGLVSLSSPKPFEVMNVESLPVDIVPIEEVPQMLQGDKKSPMNEKPAPLPTKRPDIVPAAEKIGENSVDTDAPPTPEAKPKPVQTASLPEPSPEPEPKPVKEVEPEPAKPEPKPVVPATEVLPEPKPQETVQPDPVAEAIEQPPPEPKEPDAAPLPDQAPAPQAKPKPPEAQTAKAPERKTAEKPVKEASAKPKSEEKPTNPLDEVAALLDKQKASGGGAKRSTQEASLGGKTKTGAKLSQSETDALKSQLSGCWSIPAGLADGAGLRVSIRFDLDSTGKLNGRPSVATSSGDRTFDESAVRAVQKCDRDGLQVPMERADVLAEGFLINFDPSEMF